MDNYATHKTPAVRHWLARHPRWHVHFTPTGASWLNQVERFFALLTEKQLRPGVHRSTRELEQAIRNYIDTVNADPRPFRWTKSADDILATIKRFCLRTLETAERQIKIIKTSESDTRRSAVGARLPISCPKPFRCSAPSHEPHARCCRNGLAGL